MPEKPITAAEIRRMLDQGNTYAEIAVTTGYAEQTLRNRVTAEKKRVPENNPPAWQFAPWWVRRAHTSTKTGRMLLFATALERGEAVGESLIERGVQAWVSRLKDNDFVISYHPDTPPNRLEKKGGFFFRPRRAGDSPGLMQIPSPEECPPSQAQLQEWSDMFD